MIFSSHIFIFIFLPVVLFGYFGLNRFFGSMAARLFLVASCLFFYGWFNVAYLPLIIFSMGGNYILASLTEKTNQERGKNIWFAGGLLFNLGLLGYFKYRDFFVATVNTVAQTDMVMLNLLLPLGISFFTFQQISYLYDIRWNKLPGNYSIIDYMLFVTFFPQLIAGPIVLPDEMMSQFADPTRRKADYGNISVGLWLFAIGLGKKILLADFFAVWADSGFAAQSLTLVEGWKTALAYAFQIYFDFSGYCDMALGLGMMFNIRLPLNFNSPYKADGIQDFWRRWHMTLGRFLSMFVYFPLGGSRRSYWRTSGNLLITFFISGLWHGAGWLFVLWGIMHGAAVVTQRTFSKLSPRPLPVPCARLLTFLFVMLAWVLFRAETLPSALKVYRGMVDFTPAGVADMFDDVSKNNLSMLILALLIIFVMPNVASKIDSFKPNLWNGLVTVLLLAGSVFMMNRISPFIYFNF